MRYATQEDFITLLMQGEYYQGYVDGIGIAYSDRMMILSASPPLPYNPLAVKNNQFWYHSVERLVIRPLKVIAPRDVPASHEMKDLYQQTYRSNNGVTYFPR